MQIRFIDLVEMEFSLPKPIRRESRWLFHPDMLAELETLRDSWGMRLLKTTDQGRCELLEYPAEASSAVPSREIWFGTKRHRIKKNFEGSRVRTTLHGEPEHERA